MSIFVAGHTRCERISIALVLKGRGNHSVYEVEDAARLLEALKSKGPHDLIITGNRMPYLGAGVGVLRALRQDERFKNIPVIVYTSDPDGGLEKTVRELGGRLVPKRVGRLQNLLDAVAEEIHKNKQSPETPS